MTFPNYRQLASTDCGPTCLQIIAKYYGRNISLQKLRKLSETTHDGSSLRTLSDAAEKIGFRTLGVKLNFKKLAEEVILPCIVFFDQHHFVVVYRVKKNKVYISDPAHGLLTYSKDVFIKHWLGNNVSINAEQGITLLLEPTPNLQEVETDDIDKKEGFAFLAKYLFQYKSLLIQLMIGLFIGSFLQLLFPLITQSLVDVGIQNQDIHFVYLILIARLALELGSALVMIIRGWIVLHLSTRVSISLISDFFIRLMNLPIAFFDVKMTGDILQRINDHQRVEKLLTNTSLSVLFAFVNVFMFGGVLAWYNMQIFSVFFFSSIFYFVWIAIFLKKRRGLDYIHFSQKSSSQSKVLELINGMQEIKLHNAEKQQRWSWEYLQARIFKIRMKVLILGQTHTEGSKFILNIKDIIIVFLSVKLVIDGDITLGMMISISYINGQLTAPFQELINFIYTAQDAKIALERLTEIHNKDEEDHTDDKIKSIPDNSDFYIKNINFRYVGAIDKVIKNLNFNIPANKITAIVGASGSGKTTLMKILLKFYEVETGEIKIGNYQLNNISQKTWREQCGTVMQDGYIFNDTIANNIALGEEYINKEKLIQSAEMANIKEFVENLPLTYNTKIGKEGIGMSGGQKQRLLIARAIYKDPKFMFFDEATSALDAKNEAIIMGNLNRFFKGRTVFVIAHRLSTVKNADQIIVLEAGELIEKGTHEQLISLKGSYFNLIKNQLQLESLNEK